MLQGEILQRLKGYSKEFQSHKISSLMKLKIAERRCGTKNGDRKIFMKVENREPSQLAKYSTSVDFTIIDFATKTTVVKQDFYFLLLNIVVNKSSSICWGVLRLHIKLTL